MSHFSAKTLRALIRKGVRIVGLQYLPDMSSAMPMANGETGYVVDDNGCGKVWTFRQVLEAAK